jgi:hypothetical protein
MTGREMLNKVGPSCLKLLEQLLEPDWTKRITAEEALKSDFIRLNSQEPRRQ